jgi:hypothetical protein
MVVRLRFMLVSFMPGNAAAPDSSATVPDSHPRQTTLSTVFGQRLGGDVEEQRLGAGRQEPAHFEPEVRKREKARMASPDELTDIDIRSL